MVTPSHKKRLLSVLVLCFVGQTALVYGDRREEPLSAEALRGREIFHDEACQVCHQLYGQGGFLGPDLTNVHSRVDEARFRSLLTVGSGQMPALALEAAQISDLRAFFREIDRPDLGRGQLRLGSVDGDGPQAAFDAAVRAAVPTGSTAEEGFAAFAARPCSQCHFPMQTSPVGAPDLSTVAGRLSMEELRTVLTDGRIEKGMPPPFPALTPEEKDALISYLEWLGGERDVVAADMDARIDRSLDWGALPWWEFR
jgi:nitric oxide reductase subunit C